MKHPKNPLHLRLFHKARIQRTLQPGHSHRILVLVLYQVVIRKIWLLIHKMILPIHRITPLIRRVNPIIRRDKQHILKNNRDMVIRSRYLTLRVTAVRILIKAVRRSSHMVELRGRLLTNMLIIHHRKSRIAVFSEQNYSTYSSLLTIPNIYLCCEQCSLVSGILSLLILIEFLMYVSEIFSMFLAPRQIFVLHLSINLFLLPLLFSFVPEYAALCDSHIHSFICKVRKLWISI